MIFEDEPAKKLAELLDFTDRLATKQKCYARNLLGCKDGR